MNQPPTEQISSEMLDAATIEYLRAQGYSEKAIQAKKQSDTASWQDGERRARRILEAAGVPALLARIAELEAENERLKSEMGEEIELIYLTGADRTALTAEGIDRIEAKPEGGTGE